MTTPTEDSTPRSSRSLARGAGAMVALAFNTIIGVTLLLPTALLKLALPVSAVRRRVDRILNAIAEQWIRNNSKLLRHVTWQIHLPQDLRTDRWYLVSANHQSWADIIVLQHVLTGKIPLLKFFLKRQLIWVPLIGLAWWALDFPFMKRHSKEFLERHPERRGDDLVAIRRACEKFSLIPTAVMNFVEGTRFTAEKQRTGGSTYQHLLNPKAGGLALALNAMGEQFHSMLDVTIFYPGGAPSFFGLFAGEASRIIVHVEELAIPLDLVSGNYVADPEFRSRMQEWITAIWRRKDQMLDDLDQGSLR